MSGKKVWNIPNFIVFKNAEIFSDEKIPEMISPTPTAACIRIFPAVANPSTTALTKKEAPNKKLLFKSSPKTPVLNASRITINPSPNEVPIFAKSTLFNCSKRGKRTEFSCPAKPTKKLRILSPIPAKMSAERSNSPALLLRISA